ncbi:DedA family protein [Aquipuribacter nitratireducens]|uniref:DedA family protein n=1 Tax=Aquipuribacter nitratireducens TaxID=650104 RepID=A0ABW0GLT4_9MICO
MQQPELTGVAAWAVGVMEALGGPGAGVVVALENLFPPIPSEVVLPLAGFTASQGTFTVAGAVAWTTLGSLVGALVLYGLGRWVGARRVRAVAARIPLVDARDVDTAERWFRRHGEAAVFFGRMLPVVRSAISVPAGAEAMPLWRFTLLTTAGSALWNSVFVCAGYLLGENWQAVAPYAEVLQTVVVAALALLVVWFVVVRLRRRRSEGGAAPR